MKASNIYLVAGVVLMGLVIVASQYFIYPSNSKTSQMSGDTTDANRPVVSSDGLATMNILAQSGVQVSPITAWQVIAADILFDTFITGYEISDGNNALAKPAKIEIQLTHAPKHVPYVFQEINGLVSLVDSVEYIVENGVVSGFRVEIFGEGKVFALEQYNYRGTAPVISPHYAQTVLQAGEVVSGEIGFSLNPDMAFYGQDRNRERAMKVDLSDFTVTTRLSNGGQTQTYALSEVMTNPGTLSVSVVTDEVCGNGSPLPDVAIDMTYTADLYERGIANWLKEPGNVVEWQEDEGEPLLYQQTFIVRQPFICVAE